MAHLLGSNNCLESLQRDIEDIHQTVRDMLEKTGPFRVQSWKFPDRLSQELDINELLRTYSHSKDEDHNRLSHIVLYELVIDRFVFLLQGVSVFLDQFLDTTDSSSVSRPKSKTVGSTMSIGLVVKKFWSKAVNARYCISQMKQKVKEKSNATSNMELMVLQLREENMLINEILGSVRDESVPSEHKIDKLHRTRKKKTSCAKFVTGENGQNISGELTYSLNDLTLNEDFAEMATQTYETSFIPCEACSRMQQNIVKVGEAVINLCESQGLPSSLAKQKKLLRQSLMAASDVTRWSVEQTRDIERINKHLDHLYQQIDPLKEQLEKSRGSCRGLQERIKEMKNAKEDQQLELMKQRKCHEEQVSKLVEENNSIVTDMEIQVKELQNGKEALQEICVKLNKDNNEYKQTATTLEKDNIELTERLKSEVAETCRLRDVEKEFHVLRKELEDVQRKLYEMEIQLGKAHAENKALIKRDKALQSKQESLLNRIDDLDHDCEELQNKVADLEEEKDQVIENLRNSKEENVVLDKHLADTKELLETISEEKSHTESAVENLKSEINELTEEIHMKDEKLKLTSEFPVIGTDIGDHENIRHNTSQYSLNDGEDAYTQTINGGNISYEMENQIKANNVRIGILEEQNETLRNSLHKLDEFQLQSKKAIPSDRVQLWNSDNKSNTMYKTKDELLIQDIDTSHSDTLPSMYKPLLGPHDAWSPREQHHGLEMLSQTDPKPPSKPRPRSSKLNEKRQSFAIGAQIASSGKSKPAKMLADNKYEWDKSKVLDHPTLAWSSGGKPKSGRKSKNTCGTLVNRNTPSPLPIKMFMCLDCDKMYTTQKDLDIHKSFCYARL